MTVGVDITPSVPLWFDLLAVSIGAIAGALAAAREQFDLTGVALVAVISGRGGGLIRDTLLQEGAPVALTSPWLLPSALTAALLAVLFTRVMTTRASQTLLLATDALVLGVYSISGTARALNAGLPAVSCVLVGVLTGIGGGILRDLLVSRQPGALRPGTYAALIATAGCALAVLGVRGLGLPAGVGTAGVVIIVLGRALALHRGWESSSVTQPDR